MIIYFILRYIEAMVKHFGKFNISSLARTYGKSSVDALTGFLHQDWDGQEELHYLIQRVHPLTEGYLVIDDTWLPKSFSAINPSVSKQYSGKHKVALMGMTVVMLLWTDGKWRIPLAIRVWRRGGPTKPELALEMLSWIRNKLHWTPKAVLFDAAYATKKILRRIEAYGWMFVCQCPKSRKLDGVKLWKYKRQGYWTSVGEAWCGLRLKVIRIKDRYYLCNRLKKGRKAILEAFSSRPIIEETFRILKQECGWIGCQLHDNEALVRFLHLSLMTFLTLESLRIKELKDMTIYKIRQNAIFGKIKLGMPRIKRVLRVS